jgi:hypothetical protein
LIDTLPHQRKAITAVKDALTESHGSAFALEFIRLHRSAIYTAVRTRVCGRSTIQIESEWISITARHSGL